jgi:hypothetical protein
METAVKEKKTRVPKEVNTTSTTTEGNSLRHIYGVLKGKISYDESIFNFGKKRVTI